MLKRLWIFVGGSSIWFSMIAFLSHQILERGYSLRVHVAYSLLVVASTGFLFFSSQWLSKKQGRGWALLSFAALVLSTALLIYLTGREEMGARVILRLRENAPVPRRLELSRGFPNSMHFLDHKVEFSYDEETRTFSTIDSSLRCGQWTLIPHPNYQWQPISIPSDGAKEFVESEVEFIPIWDGEPDSPSSVEDVLKDPELPPIPDPGRPRQALAKEPEVVAPERSPQSQEISGQRGTSDASPGSPGTSLRASPPPPTPQEKDALWTREESAPRSASELTDEIRLETELAKAKRRASQYGRQGLADKAIRVLSDFIEQYPNTPQAQEAKQEREKYYGNLQ